MRNENEMKLEFLSKSNNEAFARITVAAFVASLDPTIEEISDIKTAVSEAVTNSIVHGYEDKIGIINKGKLLFVGTLEEMRNELKENKSLEELFMEITEND